MSKQIPTVIPPFYLSVLNILMPTIRYKRPVTRSSTCPILLPVRLPATSISNPAPMIRTITTAMMLITVKVIFMEKRMFFLSSLAERPDTTYPIIWASTSS